MFWFVARTSGLCVIAFLVGAVVTWLPSRATVRELRALLSAVAARPALPAPTIQAPAGGDDAEVVDDAAVVDDIEYPVKGSAKSMVFHTPASPYFKRMKGDVTFRSVAEAERAGYAPWTPKVRTAAR